MTTRRGFASLDALAESLGSQIMLIAGHDVLAFGDVWELELDDEARVRIFAEYTAFLVTFADRLALGRLGEPDRSTLMNAAIDKIKRGFVRQRNFGKTEDERGDFYEELVSSRLQDYASCKEMGEHIFAASRKLVETFCAHVPRNRLPDVALETGKVISMTVTAALATLPCFKALT